MCMRKRDRERGRERARERRQPSVCASAQPLRDLLNQGFPKCSNPLRFLSCFLWGGFRPSNRPNSWQKEAISAKRIITADIKVSDKREKIPFGCTLSSMPSQLFRNSWTTGRCFPCFFFPSFLPQPFSVSRYIHTSIRFLMAATSSLSLCPSERREDTRLGHGLWHATLIL